MNNRITFFLVCTALLFALLVGCAPTTSAPEAGTIPPAAAETATSVPETPATAETSVITETSEMTETSSMTEASPMTETVEMTETSEVTETSAMTAPSVGLANPASQYCSDQGGTLTIEKRGDGGEFGVCTFEDNLQCEEWAMMRGQCPVGGIKVTGYLTPAARYCAITGGEYADNGTTSEADEKGTCTFPSGSVCPAAEYYNGTCSAE
jgi:putative hemolysin